MYAEITVKKNVQKENNPLEGIRFATIIDTLLLGLGVIIADTKRFLVVIDVLIPRTDLTPEEDLIVTTFRKALTRIDNELEELKKVGNAHVDQVHRASNMGQASGSS
jgi:hypothetical protein